MIQELKKYQINIFDESYTILSDEPESEIHQAASLVDSSIKELAVKTDNVDVKKFAIFVAFKLARKLSQLECENNNATSGHEKIIQLIDQSLKINKE